MAGAARAQEGHLSGPRLPPSGENRFQFVRWHHFELRIRALRRFLVGAPPPELRHVARTVAIAVAKQAIADGVAKSMSAKAIERRVTETMWEPDYQPYKRVRRGRPHTTGPFWRR